nr:hypothetical protein [Gammaproteobacteria bacterium]
MRPPWNFALNSVAPEHQEIELPGAHSDIGGGYPVLMEEHLLLTAPRAATIRPGQPLERSRVWQEATREAATLQMRGLPGDGELKPTAWSRHSMYPNRENTADQETLVGVTLRRRVRGELSASPCGPCAKRHPLWFLVALHGQKNKTPQGATGKRRVNTAPRVPLATSRLPPRSRTMP